MCLCCLCFFPGCLLLGVLLLNCCLNFWFRWVLLDILGVLVCLLSGSHCFGFVLSVVFLRLVRVFVAGGFAVELGEVLWALQLLPKRTNTQAREQEHHLERKNAEPNNTHLPFVGWWWWFQFRVNFFPDKNERTHPSQTKKIGDVLFFAYLPYEKPLLPPKTGLR